MSPVYRKTVSIGIALSFCALAITGILSFFVDYNRSIASVHTIFGIIFILGTILHFANNSNVFVKYFSRGKKISGWAIFPGLLSIVIVVFYLSYYQKYPIGNLMDWGARIKQGVEWTSPASEAFASYNMGNSGPLEIELEFKKGSQFWHPQISIWAESSDGVFLQNLFVTKATATGMFFGGRTKENFKEFDAAQVASTKDYRRVNALPHWSHQRGIVYEDGHLVPTRKKPLSDAVTGATPAGNFIVKSAVDEDLEYFVLKMEINIAFDDNEYFSEFDFPDDEIFHNGTGQLGQPSLIYETRVDMNDNIPYYLMQLAGHGHHSGSDGHVYKDLTKLTTALEIVDRIIVKVTHIKAN